MAISTAPKYTSLAAMIRDQIKQQVLMPGDRLPSINEMCAQHGVAPTTISKVYSVLQQEGLIECGRGRGSFVASPPQKATTGIIGISGMASSVLPQPNAHPHVVELMRGILQVALPAGVEILLLNEGVQREWHQLDGVITYGAFGPDMLRDLPKGMPAVGTLVSAPGAVCVGADDYTGISAIIQHLLALGHRRIAAMFDPLPRRLTAYTESLYAAGIEPNPRWIRRFTPDFEKGSHYPEAGYETMTQWLKEDWHELGCTALVAHNDDTANGAIEAMREAGSSVPGDVSVTGFDGAEYGRYHRLFLTTVEVPLRQIGATAMELLIKQIAGEKVMHSTLTLPVTLKIGESTGPVP